MHLLLKTFFFVEQVNQSNSKEESAVRTVRQEFKEDEILAAQKMFVALILFSLRSSLPILPRPI